MARSAIFSLFFITFLVSNIQAQDIHLSQIHASPTVINPSMNGLINEGDIRLIALSRTQWASAGNGFKSIVGSADMKLKPLGNGSVLGGGLQFYADQAGDLDFSTVSANLSLSMIKSFDRNGDNLVAFGFQNGLVRNGIDFSKMEGGEAENFGDVSSNISYWDFGAGVSWFHKFNRHNSLYAGLAMSHINKPNVAFLGSYNAQRPEEAEVSLFRKFTIHSGANMIFGDHITLMPSFLFADQGPHREISMGTYVKYDKNHRARRNANVSFYIGTWFRYYIETDIAGVDALVASFRVDLKKTFFTFSYDINMSSFRIASSGQGGPELSVIHIIESNRNMSKSSRIMCPINF